MTQLSIPFLFNGAWFSSITAQSSLDSASVGGIWGASYCGLNNPPTTILAYFNTSVSYKSVTDWMRWDVSASAGFVGNVFLNVLEKDSNDNIVNTRYLGSLFWVLESSNVADGLRTVTFSGVTVEDKFKIYITFILSDILGKIDYGNAIVTPKSVESIIEIDNYPYKNPKNYLSIVVGVVSGSSSLQAYASATAVQSGSGEDQVYVAFANNAQINNVTTQVKVDAVVTNSSTLQNQNLVIQAQMRYKAGFDVRLFTITFPAGASAITYDPTMGSGTPPPAVAGDDSFPVWAIIVIIVGALVISGAVIAFVLIRKKRYTKF